MESIIKITGVTTLDEANLLSRLFKQNFFNGLDNPATGICTNSYTARNLNQKEKGFTTLKELPNILKETSSSSKVYIHHTSYNQDISKELKFLKQFYEVNFITGIQFHNQISPKELESVKKLMPDIETIIEITKEEFEKNPFKMAKKIRLEYNNTIDRISIKPSNEKNHKCDFEKLNDWCEAIDSILNSQIIITGFSAANIKLRLKKFEEYSPNKEFSIEAGEKLFDKNNHLNYQKTKKFYTFAQKIKSEIKNKQTYLSN